MGSYLFHRLQAQSLILLLIIFGNLSEGLTDPCDAGACYPATGNLIIGRQHQLTASSTCGLKNEERYCLVSQLDDQKRCYKCDSRDETLGNPVVNHRIDNVLNAIAPGYCYNINPKYYPWYCFASDYCTQQRSWWQSQAGVENVTIQLNLEAELFMTHVIMTFKTFRPAAMSIERSSDFGKSWKIYRYFADNCDTSYPGIPKDESESIRMRGRAWHNARQLLWPEYTMARKPVSRQSIFNPICESRYSKINPSTEGEVIFRVFPRSYEIKDPYADEIVDMLKVTNIRFNFKKLHTLNNDDLSDGKTDTMEKYFYAVYNIMIRGSCFCNGHSSRCVPLKKDGFPKTMPFDMVHGKCECSHNTQGINCEKCLDLYNDLPWMPARGFQSNSCKRCDCNNHATSCHFDPNVYNSTGGRSGGVCYNCGHNTTGRNCDQCKEGFHLAPDMHISHPDACQPLVTK